MTEFLLEMSGQPWIYAVVALACLLDGLFPPIPSETVVVGLAALATSQGGHGLWLLFLAAVLGAFLGDNLAYVLGRRMGVSRFAWMRRPVMQKAFARAGGALESRGVSMILVARFLPVARVAVNLTAGASGYPARKFMPVSLLSATLWGGYSVGIGAVAGIWMGEHPLLGLFAAIVVAGLLGLGLDRVAGVVQARRKRVDSTGTAGSNASQAALEKVDALAGS